MRAAQWMSMAILAVVLPTLAEAQERRSSGPGGPPPYNLEKEQTITGRIVESKTVGEEMGRPMVILTITVENRRLHALLAPPDFVQKQRVPLEAGKTVELKAVPGYRVNGEDAVMVREAKVGEATLTLRDKDGTPRWPSPSGR
jgi:hypothetical protein